MDENLFDFTIIGGGIHGVTIATFLVNAGYSKNNICIIDPGNELLAKWKESTEAVGVAQLRSTHVNHVAPDPYSLIKFSKTVDGKNAGKLRGHYGHPDLELFNLHCDTIIKELELDSLHIKGEVSDLEYQDLKWSIKLTDQKVIFSDKVIFSTGCKSNLPKWFSKENFIDNKVYNYIDYKISEESANKKVLIVGGGMSGIQLSSKLAKNKYKNLTLISKEFPLVSLFDSAPGWIGPKYLNKFRKNNSFNQRREIINSARKKGSAPSKIVNEFKAMIQENKLKFIKGNLLSAVSSKDSLDVSFKDFEKDKDIQSNFDQIIFATGLTSNCLEDGAINKIANKYKLPISKCNFPIPASLSYWGKNIFLSGSLAELQVGPVARNIVGGRIAAGDILRRVSL